jgi:N,N'-diacetylchitobiose transport system substrate-binding protein
VKHRHLTAAGAAVIIAGVAAACGSSTTGSPGGATSSAPVTLEVWLMSGSAPASLVTAWNNQFQQEHPGVTVHVDLQQWTGIVTKTDSALSTSTPDVLEMGNTYVAGFASTGGLQDLSKVNFENESTWLTSLKAAGTYNGKLYGVPYYAGDRIAIYRKSMFAAAGITNPPATTADLMSDLQKLKAAEPSSVSPIYIAGKYWYAIFSWLADDYGTQSSASDFIASQSGGQWKANFESSQDQQALTWVDNLFTSGLDKAPADQDETNDNTAFEANKAAIVIEPGWDYGVIQSDFTKAGNSNAANDLGVFPIPGNSGPAPTFLGGSNLGVNVHSKNQALADEYIQLVTGTQYESEMATVGGVIPNSTTLLNLQAQNPVLNAAAQAATNSWFTPNTPKEASLESQNVYTDMLANIFTGKMSVQQATQAADQQADSILNGS